METKKEIIDISVAFVNLNIKIGRILLMCLAIKPVPKFVPLLARCTNNYDVFIKAKYFNEPDLSIKQILEEKTDYEAANSNIEEKSNEGKTRNTYLKPEIFYDDEYIEELKETRRTKEKSGNLSSDKGEVTAEQIDNNGGSEVAPRMRQERSNIDKMKQSVDLDAESNKRYTNCNSDNGEYEKIISNPKFYTKLLLFMLESGHIRRLMSTRDIGLVRAILAEDKLKELPDLAVPVIRSVVDGKMTVEEFRDISRDVEYPDKREIEQLIGFLK